MTAYEQIEELWGLVDRLEARLAWFEYITPLKDQLIELSEQRVKHRDRTIELRESQLTEARTRLAAIEAAASG